jgi:hypothetical protein
LTEVVVIVLNDVDNASLLPETNVSSVDPLSALRNFKPNTKEAANIKSQQNLESPLDQVVGL